MKIPLTFHSFNDLCGLCVTVFCVLRLSKCVHSLIKLSLPSGVSEVEAHVLEEVWDYYEEALSIIAAAVSQHQSHTPPSLSSHLLFPPTELLPAI